MYVIDKELAEKFKVEGYNLLQETNIGNTPTWVFSLNNNYNKLNFENLDRKKILLTNKLNF
jgi:hypothetical protein